MVRPRTKPIGDTMRDLKTVNNEAIVIGASIFVVGSVLMFLPLPDSIKQHPAWPFVGTFIAGYSTHWIFELIGGNKYYCDNFEA